MLRPFASADMAERLALTPLDPAQIWIHGASVGELNSARLLIDELARRHSVLITANSLTGRDLVRGWGLSAQLAPLDAPQVLRRFLDTVAPRIAITLENEIWPERNRQAARRNIEQFVIGARMSERSCRRWQRARGLIAPSLARLAGLSAQDSASEARFRALGLPQSAVLAPLQLKLLAPARVEAPPASAQRDQTILAASTHEGEDAPIIDAFAAMARHHPKARLILAPRHPARADAVAALLEMRGLGFVRRSQGNDLGASAPVLLADTLGEMARWYEAAGICLTAGSWVGRGGHTPWEPAAHSCAILHGPDTRNFAEDYAALNTARASWQVGPDDLADRLTALIDAPDRARRMGLRARALLDQRAGDPGPLIARLSAAAGSGHAPE